MKKPIWKHPYYNVWRNIMQRCNNPNSTSYHNYGGRGIKVCKRWKNDFWKFVDDMGDRPDGFTIERIDVNKGYKPSNCKWASKLEQSRNTRVVNKAKYYHYHKSTGRWQVMVRINDVRKYIGLYDTEKEAKEVVEKYKTLRKASSGKDGQKLENMASREGRG